MKARRGRNSDVSQTLVAPATEIPRDAELAFEELYRSSRDDLYAYVAGMLRDRAAAEDVTAAAFERAYCKRRRFDPRRGTARAWLFVIARNAALDELRRRRRQAALLVEPEDALAEPVSGVAERSERRAALARALDGLEPSERELVVLKFFSGLTNPEIARVLGISDTNAGTRLHRVISKLREACHETA